MGTGKTTVGEKLAKGLSYDFVDSDKEIEKALGLSIPDIFKTYGEEYFRQIEYEVILGIMENRGMVVSTGGGSVMNEELFDLLLSQGIVINLEASIETLYNRLKSSNNRPMLYGGDFKDRITQLYNFRYPIYKRAHYTIDTEHKDQNQITRDIIQLINRKDALKS